MYLSQRIKKLCLDKNEYLDGGLLIAAHIMDNKLIGSRFKRYLKKRVAFLRGMMMNDSNAIGYNTIFDELNLYSFIQDKTDRPGYIAEKFDSYLCDEARREIESGSGTSFMTELAIYKDSPSEGSNPFWATWKLFSIELFLDKFRSIKEHKELTYADIYELSLELIFERLVDDNGRTKKK